MSELDQANKTAERREIRLRALDGVLREMGRRRSAGADEGFVARVMRAVDRATPGRVVRRWRWPVPLALAASLLAVAGIWFLNVRERQPWPFGPPVATVTEAAGTIRGQGPDGTRFAVKAGQTLFAGQRLETESGAQLTFAFIAQSSEIVLGESAVLSVSSPARLRLERGGLSATVSARPSDFPFAVDTPNARVEVLGTRFRVEVRGGTEKVKSEKWKVKSEDAPLDTGNGKLETGGSTSDNQSTINNQKSKIPPPSTRLDVDGGQVRFTRLADQESVDVAAGEFAVAGEDIVLKPYPQETEWIEGRVIFEDDFISGPEHWNFLQSREEKDGSGLYEPFAAEAGRAIEAAIADPPRNGRKETGVLVKAGDASPSVAPLIVWNRTIEARAYSVEWICRFDLREASGSSGGPHSLRVEGGRSVRSRSSDVSTSQNYLWRVLREEVTPLDTATQPYAWKIRTLHDGAETSVTHANFSQESIAFRVSRGNIFVSRCTVRELIPVGSRHRGDEERTRP